MCHDNEEWCKVWRGTDLLFQNWHEEFDKFWLETFKVWKSFFMTRINRKHKHRCMNIKFLLSIFSEKNLYMRQLKKKINNFGRFFMLWHILMRLSCIKYACCNLVLTGKSICLGAQLHVWEKVYLKSDYNSFWYFSLSLNFLWKHSLKSIIYNAFGLLTYVCCKSCGEGRKLRKTSENLFCLDHCQMEISRDKSLMYELNDSC